MELALDVDEMRAELGQATDEALLLADRLADLARTQIVDAAHLSAVARDYQLKRRDARRLRLAIKAEVAG